ncbi:MFS transporter [Natronorubrum daqingense]|uniref:MFS transporter n=1 Tax=Natronorubrum daqingense TaxID=588898 RepID=A0A1N7F3G9_9EURY|nr:MFS transporter [Natronorubrum daqingense]APX97512.1 MFS transporter [Natronorubrum daqingense]SIR94930.1 Sugar phosphate permease [Natronorubrum daqingense]
MDDNDRSIVTFVSLSHMMVHTYEFAVPILMTVWLLEFSVTAATLGAVVTVGYFLFGVGALPAGMLVDRFGSRPLIFACLIGMALSFLLLGIASNVYVVALALGLWGIAASVHHPAGLTLISKGVSDPGWAYAYHGMAGNVGIAFGPLATALLLLAFDWRLVAALLVVPTVITIGIGLTLSFDETAQVTATDGGGTQSKGEITPSSFVSDTRLLATVGFLTVFAIVMFNGLYYRGVLTFLPDMLGGFLADLDIHLDLFDPDSPYAEEFDLAQYVYVGLLMIGILGQYIGGILTSRIPTERGLVIALGALTILGITYVPAATAGFGPLLVVSALLGVFLFAMQPLTQATIAAYSPAEARGLSFGWTFLAIFGIGSLGATIAGFVLTYASANVLFLVLACFAGTGCLLALSLVVRNRAGE